jgi:antitoxin HigA-1
MPNKKLEPAHPGAILREEFLEVLGVTAYRVAKELNVPLPRLNDIVLEKRGISPQMGVLLARYFDTSDQFFLNLQCDYDRRLAHVALGSKLAKIKPLNSAPKA